MGDDQQQAGGNANIFQQSGGAPPASGGQGGNQGASAPMTNTSGDLTAGGSSSGSGSARTGAAGQSPGVSSSAAYQANTGKENSGVDFSGVNSGVAGRGAALQNEANSYITANTGPSTLSTQDQTDLHRAVDSNWGGPSGDETGFIPGAGPSHESTDYWSGLMAGSPKTVGPFKSTVNTVDPNTDLLRTDAGVQQFLRRQGGPEYGAGDAAFDQSLLSHDTGFQQARQGALQNYDALQNKASTIGDDTTKAAQSSENDAYGKYLGSIKGTLQGLNDQYQTAADTQKTQADAAAQAQVYKQLSGGGGISDQELANLKADPNNAALVPYLNDSSSDFGNGTVLNPGKYAKNNFDPTSTTSSDYLNQGQADTFNKIAGLLGTGKSYLAGKYASGWDPSKLVTYDTAGMDRDMLGNAATGKAAADKAAADAANAKAAADKAAADKAASDKAAADQAAAAASATPPAGPAAPPIIPGVVTDTRTAPSVGPLGGPEHMIGQAGNLATTIDKKTGLDKTPYGGPVKAGNRVMNMLGFGR